MSHGCRPEAFGIELLQSDARRQERVRRRWIRIYHRLREESDFDDPRARLASNRLYGRRDETRKHLGVLATRLGAVLTRYRRASVLAGHNPEEAMCFTEESAYPPGCSNLEQSGRY